MATDQDQFKKEWLLEILNCYEGRLIQYAAKLVGDVEKAQDVVQDTFLQLWKEQRSKIEGYLEQWLFTVCRNKCLDVLKKEKRMFSLNTDIDFADTDIKSSSDDIELEETKSGVIAAMQALPANQKEVIRLKFQDELSYKEISKITGLSVSNVGFLIHSGIKLMRTKLKKNEDTVVLKRGNIR